MQQTSIAALKHCCVVAFLTSKPPQNQKTWELQDFFQSAKLASARHLSQGFLFIFTHLQLALQLQGALTEFLRFARWAAAGRGSARAKRIATRRFEEAKSISRILRVVNEIDRYLGKNEREETNDW